MTKEQNILIELLKFEFNGNMDVGVLQNVNWDKVIEEAAYQKMFPFVVDALGDLVKKHSDIDLQIEPQLLNLAKAKLLQTIGRNVEIIQRQKQVLDALQAEHIDACIIKGTSISVFYKKPNLRSLGDLDIYVKPVQIGMASDVIMKLGYQYEKTSTQYHTSFLKDAYEIELHNSVAGLPYGCARTQLLFMKDLYERGEKGDVKYGNYHVPNTCDNGLIQLLHILHHIKHRGMKLRLLYDWMMYVDKNVSDEIWEKQLKNVYEAVHLDKMAKLVTKLCKSYLGLANTDITWCDDILDKDCIALLEYVMIHDEERAKRQASGENMVCENELKEDVWEVKGGTTRASFLVVVGRNIMAILQGKKTARQCIGYYRERKYNADKLVKLNLFDKSTVGEYAYRD